MTKRNIFCAGSGRLRRRTSFRIWTTAPGSAASVGFVRTHSPGRVNLVHAYWFSYQKMGGCKQWREGGSWIPRPKVLVSPGSCLVSNLCASLSPKIQGYCKHLLLHTQTHTHKQVIFITTPVTQTRTLARTPFTQAQQRCKCTSPTHESAPKSGVNSSKKPLDF